MGSAFSRKHSLDIDPDMGKPKETELTLLLTPSASLKDNAVWNGPVVEFCDELLDFPPLDSYYLISMEHVKGRGPKPHHECLILQVRCIADEQPPSIRWIRLDRFIDLTANGTFASPGPSSSGAAVPIADRPCGAECSSQAGASAKPKRPTLSTASSSATSLSSVSPTIVKEFPAEDKAVVAMNRNEFFRAEGMGYDVCQQVTYSPTTSAPPLRRIVDLLEVIETHYPRYHALGKACFWFASTIWDVVVDKSYRQGVVTRGPAFDQKGRPATYVPAGFFSFSNDVNQVQSVWSQSISKLTPVEDFRCEEVSDAQVLYGGNGHFYVQPCIGNEIPLFLGAQGKFQACGDEYISKAISRGGHCEWTLHRDRSSIELQLSYLDTVDLVFNSQSHAVTCFSYLRQFAQDGHLERMPQVFDVRMILKSDVWLAFRNPNLIETRILPSRPPDPSTLRNRFNEDFIHLNLLILRNAHENIDLGNGEFSQTHGITQARTPTGHTLTFSTKTNPFLFKLLFVDGDGRSIFQRTYKPRGHVFSLAGVAEWTEFWNIYLRDQFGGDQAGSTPVPPVNGPSLPS
ncbi:hypothetical protein JAAARDRAFT_72943 [Jaapia argillacea MUCL 33604]|uniref:Uncharacterized protein n=1 Tax=Jaapia argillacea MUCL 33604 TaxID=933084 RepID=A0A067PN44_9AGAM|nr:hypothetical protein JAAARDRAFT_72943 [Jaapia argillacea MUCL 33604]